MIRTLLALAVAAGTASVAFAQSPSESPNPPAPASDTALRASPKVPGPLTAYLLLSLPQGEFADDDNGLAKTGFGLAAEFAKTLQGSQNLELRVGASYAYNPMDLSTVEEVLGDWGVSVEGGGWHNISLLGGLRGYLTEPGNGVYVQGMAGLNLAKAGAITISDGYDKVRQTWSMAASPVFSVGAGFRNGPLDFSLRYLNMGEPELEGELEADGETYDAGKGKQKISMIVVMVGYNF